jgi:hypothetical protein
MAKDPKRPAGGFESENTSGFLSGLVAEENPFDRRALWRLGSWGLVAVCAVTIAVMSNQSSIALRRDEVAATDLARQAQQLQSVTRESQNETRRLASAVDTLNSDRDRLYTRITVLEQGLDSVTGTIQHQNPGAAAVQPNPVQAAPVLAAPVPATPAPDPQVWLQNLTPTAPALSQVATAAPKAADKPNAEAKPTVKGADKPDTEAKAAAKAADRPNTEAKAAEKTKADAAAPEKGAAAVLSAAPAASNAIAAPPLAALMAAKSIMAPPDPAAGKLIESTRPETVAAATLKPEAEALVTRGREEPEASEADLTNVAVIQRTEFGVDVGGANSIAGLRALWRGLVKTRSTATVAALRPIIVIKEASNGLGMQLRLVAGPLSDAAAAAKICARMTENNRPCETTVFEGQRLTIKAEDDAKSPVLKPVARKRSTQVTAPEEPKKPDPPSTLSAMFGKR